MKLIKYLVSALSISAALLFFIILESSFPLTCTCIEDAYEAKFAYAFDSVITQCEYPVSGIKEATIMYRRNACSLLRAQCGASFPQKSAAFWV